MLAGIASAFGSIFTYKELLSLDLREEQFWFSEMRKKRLSDFMSLVQAIRLAMSSKETYEREMQRMRKELDVLTRGKAAVVTEDWEALTAVAVNRRK